MEAFPAAKPENKPESLKETERAILGARPWVEMYCKETLNKYRKNLGDTIGEDVAQDVMLRALAKVANYSSEFSINTWLGRIARNACIDQMRAAHNSRRVERTEPGDGEEDFLGVMSNLDHPIDNLDVQAINKIDLERAMTHVSPHEMELLRLHYEKGLSYKELAARFNIKVSTVKNRLFVARQRLEPHLKR